ncbi:2-phospho-L-lactate guanylyltransferase [Agromyces rhizosphaerae]|uniref:2-phospho-L-lactate guanylyltransferase n=1 Tax=Agromyces rhizosphaerae TaxID=88374 RepID=A0A9W6CXG9_9MICO|nr:2-phospho-L-lactate guanylyltransferase [Agromyces rhizosphaerae]GLI27440.1 2-phospho-L-lactate guanylyltransferase [Agromyces rhizosphaerae]
MTHWTVVIPVKEPSRAKSRLGKDVPPEARAALARAFALDTIAATAATPAVDRVVVVTHAELPIEPGPARIQLIDDGRAHGLPAAIELGIAHARATGAGWTAVLLGDLPAMRPDELDGALNAAAMHPLGFLPDADDHGTVLATAGIDVPFAPAFGGASATAHAEQGFVPLDVDGVVGLRRDVDTAEGLEVALQLGVGPNTAEAVAAFTDGVLPHHRTTTGKGTRS